MRRPAPFEVDRPLIGMVHVAALPGTPAHRLSLREMVREALDEARLLEAAGFDGVLIENMHDTPYCRANVGPEIVAALSRVCQEIRAAISLPLGLQVLAAANREAVAIAHACELDFVRVEGFAFAHVADEGLIQSCAAELLRYRRLIGAERVEIWADIKKKHSAHALTADVSISRTAEAAEFMRADAVIVTGEVTGDAPPTTALQEARKGTKLPVIIGSGVTAENVTSLWPYVDALIVGSALKYGGDWRNSIEPERAHRIASACTQLRLGGAKPDCVS